MENNLDLISNISNYDIWEKEAFLSGIKFQSDYKSNSVNYIHAHFFADLK